MPLLLRCNGFNNLFAVSFHSFCSSFFLLSFYFVFVSFFLVGLEYCTLKSLEHFSFNSVRWGGSCYFRPSIRGGLANLTLIEGMSHLISKPKFKIPTPRPPLLISDKSLRIVTIRWQYSICYIWGVFFSFIALVTSTSVLYFRFCFRVFAKQNSYFFLSSAWL